MPILYTLRNRMSQRLRVAMVQFAPLIGKVQENVAKATALCSRIEPRSVDLVCLPEMIFTGYMFPDASAISPFLEDRKTGATARFCSDLACRLHCYVAAGYPERLSSGYGAMDEESNGRWGDKVGANSAVLYGPGGDWVGAYRKTNLFDTDKSWAVPGDGFKSFLLPAPLQTLTLGICMDLNPQPPAQWTPEGPYELASYCLQEAPGKQRTNILLLLNAWLDTRVDLDVEWDWQTLDYWLARLRPLWERDSEYYSPDDADSEPKETIVIICNRNGEDGEALFAGSSVIFKLRQGSGEPEVIGLMKRREEGVKIWTI